MLKMNDPAYPHWPKGLLTEQEAAMARGLSPNTLRNRRLRGTGVPHVMVQGRAYYWWSDLAEVAPRAGGRPRKDALEITPAAPSKPAPPVEALRKARKPRARTGRVQGGKHVRWTKRQPLDWLLGVTDERGLVSEPDANTYLGLNRSTGLSNRRRAGTPMPPATKLGRRYWYRTLDLIAFDPSLWFAETRSKLSGAISYGTAHHRIAAWRGSASLYGCTWQDGCEDAADDWSYVGGCVDELIELAGREKGSRYCGHASHYVPLCRTHHRIFDQEPIRQRVAA